MFVSQVDGIFGQDGRIQVRQRADRMPFHQLDPDHESAARVEREHNRRPAAGGITRGLFEYQPFLNELAGDGGDGSRAEAGQVGEGSARNLTLSFDSIQEDGAVDAPDQISVAKQYGTHRRFTSFIE